jgi:hypothetical protein
MAVVWDSHGQDARATIEARGLHRRGGTVSLVLLNDSNLRYFSLLP